MIEFQCQISIIILPKSRCFATCFSLKIQAKHIKSSKMHASSQVGRLERMAYIFEGAPPSQTYSTGS